MWASACYPEWKVAPISKQQKPRPTIGSGNRETSTVLRERLHMVETPGGGCHHGGDYI